MSMHLQAWVSLVSACMSAFLAIYNRVWVLSSGRGSITSCYNIIVPVTSLTFILSRESIIQGIS